MSEKVATTFDNGQTEVIVQEKLLPALEELARAEFGIYSFSGNIDSESIEWMKASEQRMEAEISAYLMGLLELHLKYGNKIKEISRTTL